MNAFIGKAFFWIFGFISLLIFTTQTSVGRFLSNAFLILIGVFAVMTLLGEMGILEWAGKFKTLSSEAKLLILSTFFFFGLWLFVQYDVVNNFRADINESNIQSENEIERSSEIDALTKSEISELTSSGIIESDQQMKLSTTVNPELKIANSSNSDSVTEQTSLDINKLKSKRLLQSNLDDEIILEDQNDDPSVEVDIMRVDDTGEALVAGRTQPNTMVEILVDNEVIADAKANEDGEFVVMGNLESSSISQTLTVRSKEKVNESETISETVSKPEGPSILNKESDKPDWKLSQDIFIILPVSNKNSSKLDSNLIEAPIIVKSSSNDIKIIQNKDISSIKEIIIDSISYSDLGEAVLVGRANPSNKILVYLNNVLKSSSEVGASGGWSTELTGLEPGIYELRLDEVDASGVVKSRIMTPFKKESKDFLMNMVSGSITVQTGNSLWRIARRIFGRGIRYIEIFEKNADLIKDPNLIYPGQVFSIPTKK